MKKTPSVSKIDQRGVIPVLFMVAILGLLGFFVIAGTFGLKNNLFNALFPKSASHAAGTVDLSIVPGSLTVSANQTFSVDLAIDAKTNQVSAADLEIDFDPQFLQVQSVTP